MNDSQKELESSKQNFLKSISNAFLGPIEESLTRLEKMKNSTEPCAADESIKNVNSQLQKLRTSVKNIIFLTAIKNNTFKGQMSTIDSLTELEAFALSFQEMAKEQGLNYFIYIDPNFPQSITFNKEYIFHVLTNLLNNAFLYTPQKGNVYFDIRSKKISNEMVELSFSITDTGEGIPREKVKRLLKPLASDEAQGMGLGISSSFYVLKALDSKLKIASEENKGSRFSFSINAKTNHQPSFKSFPQLSIGLFIDSRDLLGHAKIFYQYFISMGLNVISINDLKDARLKECHALFLITAGVEKNKLESIMQFSPKTSIIPVMSQEYAQEFVDKFGQEFQQIILPAVPHKIYQILETVKKGELQAVEVKQEIEKTKVVAQPSVTAKKDSKKERKDEPVRILVAEDNPINLKLLQVVLGRYNFIIESANNGEIAVKMCKKTHYDLVLMDIDMPTMDGITANRLIKEYETKEGIPHTPIVALTSHDLAGERAEILSKGLDEHMSKPMNVARLETILERYVGYKGTKK